MIFLIEYSRETGKLISIATFSNEAQSEAEQTRLEMEVKNLRNNIYHEIVLLEAPTEDELRRTHRRYFEGLEQLTTNSH